MELLAQGKEGTKAFVRLTDNHSSSNEVYMETETDFSRFLVSQNVQVDLGEFVANLLFTGLLAILLGAVYSRYGLSLSNRRIFSRNFPLIAMTTMIIITVVKSSLALSLGLVGALSIVRFRSAIKEPEELSYLFLLISVGLGFGANQRVLTLVGFAIVVGLIIGLSRFHRREQFENMVLSVTSPTDGRINLEELVGVLNESCSEVKLKRFDEGKERFETTFLVQFSDYKQLEQGRKKIRTLEERASVTFIDNKILG